MKSIIMEASKRYCSRRSKSKNIVIENKFLKKCNTKTKALYNYHYLIRKN